MLDKELYLYTYIHYTKRFISEVIQNYYYIIKKQLDGLNLQNNTDFLDLLHNDIIDDLNTF